MFSQKFWKNYNTNLKKMTYIIIPQFPILQKMFMKREKKYHEIINQYSKYNATLTRLLLHATYKFLFPKQRICLIVISLFSVLTVLL